ncbi:ferrochelatase, partial [Klebsiella pneumoniae]|uniref:ferrochelatase n=1 Tax=Klebsiella pneumoniae TaxID=573 RepID=UPI003851C0C0
ASAEKYRAIWLKEGSPLMVWSLALQKEMQKQLEGSKVLLGMRYGEPSLASALKEAWDANRIVLVPLYPQFADATTGSTVEYFRGLA